MLSAAVALALVVTTGCAGDMLASFTDRSSLAAQLPDESKLNFGPMNEGGNNSIPSAAAVGYRPNASR